MIEFDHASFAYRAQVAEGRAGAVDVSLTVRPGEVVVLCGRSGCGKSTVLRLAGGLAPRFFPGTAHGRVSLDGRAVDTLETWEIAQRAGSLFQNPRTQFFSADSTGEVAFALENAGWPPEDIRQRVGATFEELGMSALAGRGLFRLSGGERQKVAFASLWATRPANLLLDEPTSNLDLPAVADMAEFVARAKKAGCAVLVAEHRLSWLTGIADRYVRMEAGRVDRVWDADEFAALSAEEVRRMGLRMRSADEARPVVRPPVHEAPNAGEPTHGVPGGGAAPAGDGGPAGVAAPGHRAGPRCAARPAGAHTPLLSARGLAVRFGERTVLRGADVDLREGEVCAVVGANGAGKTTLCRALCGFERRARGTVSLAGRTASRSARVRASSMVFQDVNYQLFAESVADEVVFGLPRRQGRAVDVAALLVGLDLDGLEERHPATLSGGQKQRLAVAACVAARKQVVVFDEPTSGLDLDGMRRVARLLRELAAQGRTVLVITHDLELVACACDRALVVEGGRVGATMLVADHFDAVKRAMGVSREH
ncbi:ABC transporter ATP-binding protein [Schaalia georgiae]|nr:ABC transporter ATP-binding protein [Schaalia georgiae]